MFTLKNAHYIQSADAIAIAIDMRASAIECTTGAMQNDYIAFYNHAIEFAAHNGFIDSCAWDSMMEPDYLREQIFDVECTDIDSWDIEIFMKHYLYEIQTMHHFASIEMHNLMFAHNRKECAYCTDIKDACGGCNLECISAGYAISKRDN